MRTIEPLRPDAGYRNDEGTVAHDYLRNDFPALTYEYEIKFVLDGGGHDRLLIEATCPAAAKRKALQQVECRRIYSIKRLRQMPDPVRPL